MKIALLTWFHFSNYGTALQVYALTSVLRGMGHQVDVINYKPGFFKPRTLQDMSPRSVAKWVKGKLVGESVGSPYYKSYEDPEREELFASFISEHLSFTSECRTLSDLCDLNGKYDAFVCGSDQIWSPNNFNPRYFLDFVASADKMIAYAPSIGLGHIADGYVAEQMKELIGRFKHLSVREAQGAALIRELTGAEARATLSLRILPETTLPPQTSRRQIS